MKTKKILFILILSLFSVGSLIAQPGAGGNPPMLPGDGTVKDVPAPIDGQIWVGLIVGLAIGGYLLIKRKDEPTVITDWLDKHGDPEIEKSVSARLKKLEESKSGFSCPKCDTTYSEYTFISQTEAVFKEAPDPHYSWDETHKCTNCGTMYLLHNAT